MASPLVVLTTTEGPPLNSFDWTMGKNANDVGRFSALSWRFFNSRCIERKNARRSATQNSKQNASLLLKMITKKRSVWLDQFYDKLWLSWLAKSSFKLTCVIMAQFKQDQKIFCLSPLTTVHIFSKIMSHGGPLEGDHRPVSTETGLWVDSALKYFSNHMHWCTKSITTRFLKWKKGDIFTFCHK